MPTLKNWNFDFSRTKQPRAKSILDYYLDADFRKTMTSLYHWIWLGHDWDKAKIIRKKGAASFKRDFPAKFSILGEVYGRRNFKDGDTVMTSSVAKLLFEEEGCVAVTASGYTYLLDEMGEIEKKRAKIEIALIRDEWAT